MVLGLGFAAWDPGISVWGLGLRVWTVAFGEEGLRLGVEGWFQGRGLGLWVCGSIC